MTLLELLELTAIGLAAGALGGMLGIGGSIIMIPALALILGPNQHLYQAAAMIVNIFVAIPATIHHARAGAVRLDVGWRMIVPATICIVLGVALSDQLDGIVLQRIFGMFLIYIVLFNAARLIRPQPEPKHGEQRVGMVSCGFVGVMMGFLAGLLGIGGGGIAVPLLQRVCNLPLRQCIATSSAVMCLTSIVGAVRKNATIHQHVDVQKAGTMLTIDDSFLIAICLIPTAILGGMVGARLAHALPLWWVRLAFTLLMCWACLEMLGIV